MSGINYVQEITVGQIITTITILMGIIGGILTFWKKVSPFIKSMDDFMEDWHGEPARPGRAKRPGVMETIEEIKKTQETHAEVLKELVPDRGTSIKDKIEEVINKTRNTDARLHALENKTLVLLRHLVISANLDKVERIEARQEAKTFLELISEEIRDDSSS